jgi:hypothetical protein
LALSGPFYEGLLYAAHNNRFERFTVFRPPALPGSVICPTGIMSVSNRSFSCLQLRGHIRQAV